MTAEMEANDSFSSIFLVSSYMDRIMWCISFFQLTNIKNNFSQNVPPLNVSQLDFVFLFEHFLAFLVSLTLFS